MDKWRRERGRERETEGHIEKNKGKKTTSVAYAHTRIIIKPFDVVEKGKSVHTKTHATFFFSTDNVSVSACPSS